MCCGNEVESHSHSASSLVNGAADGVQKTLRNARTALSAADICGRKTKAALRGEGVYASLLAECTCGVTPRGGRAPCRASVSADLVRVTNLLQEDTELSGSDRLSVGVKGRAVTSASSEKSLSPPRGLSDKSGVGD